jgi:hypothetical protein
MRNSACTRVSRSFGNYSAPFCIRFSFRNGRHSGEAMPFEHLVDKPRDIAKMPGRGEGYGEWFVARSTSLMSVTALSPLENSRNKSSPKHLMWSRGVARWFRWDLSVADPFSCRCLTIPAMLPFPHPAHRTGRADLPHPALGEDSHNRRSHCM